MPTVHVNNVDIAYELYGLPENPCLLLIHGLGMPCAAWPMALIERFVQDGFQVLILDNRDIGLSQKMDAAGLPNIVISTVKRMLGLRIKPAYTLNDMMQDVLSLLDYLSIEKTHVVGVSMGGMISQLLAINAPQRVQSLTSIMSTTNARSLPSSDWEVSKHMMSKPASNSDADRLAYHVKTWRLIGSPDYPTPIKELEQHIIRMAERGMTAAGTSRQLNAIIGTPDRTKALGSLTMPCQVIHGTDDPLVPVECGKATAKAIKHSKLHLIKGMGHDLPEALLQQIGDLIYTQATSVEP